MPDVYKTYQFGLSFFSPLFLNLFLFSYFVVEKNISIHSHNYIIYFNDKSGGELFTLNSCRRDNMEKRERGGERETRAHTHTHTHTHARTYAHKHSFTLTHWIGRSGEDTRVS